MARKIKIAPSLLAADLTRIGEQVTLVQSAGADIIHMDIMDGHFVPNLTFGPAIVDAVNRFSDIRIATHLMVTNPEHFIKPFADAGSDILYFHAEIHADLRVLARQIRALGVKAGITLEVHTPAEHIVQLTGEIDDILVMTVPIGYSGQEFRPGPLRKIPKLRQIFGEEIDIAVDGGIDASNAAEAVQSGANVLVGGKGIFGTGDPAAAIRQIRAAAEL